MKLVGNAPTKLLGFVIYYRKEIMPFTNPDFPGRLFNNVRELEEAVKEGQRIEQEISSRSGDAARVTATVIPVPKDALERRVALLEGVVRQLRTEEEGGRVLNKDRLPIGMVLEGESKGQSHTLEILEEGYLCSTGEISATLSSAAEVVSGNRRSGWAFWKDGQGTPIGEITGRFKKREITDPFRALEM
jgi:hypothetical protein